MKQRKSKRKQRRQRKTSKKHGGTQTPLGFIFNSVINDDLAGLQQYFEENPQRNIIKTYCKSVLITALKYGNVNIAEWGLQLCRNINPDYPILEHDKIVINNLFKDVCARGYLAAAQWMSQVFTFILPSNYELGIVYAARYGHLQVLQWLINIPGLSNNAKINAFKEACFGGALNIAQTLYNNLGSDFIPESDKDEAFNHACSQSRVDVLLWLREINPTKYEVVVNEVGELIRCSIRNPREETLRNLTYPMAANNKLLDEIDAESLEMLGDHFP
jgi:hypothetical protein